MRRRLLTALFALAVLPRFAAGADAPSAPPTALPAPVPAGPVAPQPPAVGAEPAPVPGGPLDQQPWSGPGGAPSEADWTCGPAGCFWFRGEYLLWWIKDSTVPVLATTAAPGLSALPGALGQPGTTALFGGPDVDNQTREGGRFTGGFWLNSSRTLGVEGSYFFLGSRSVRFDGTSSGTLGSPVIARPFFDVLGSAPNSQIVAFPGLASGELRIASSSQLQGGELNALCLPCCRACCNSWFSLLAGVRYLQLDEDIRVSEITRVNPGLPAGRPLFGGSTINVSDQFDTRNQFYGGQVGANGGFCSGRLSVDFRGKVALGTTHQVADVRGATSITALSGATVVTPAGFLASGSNSGHFTRDRFTVVPEVGLDVGCQITRQLRATVGYTFLYWSSVVRPGDQIDVGLSGAGIPTDTRFNPAAGPARPGVLLQDTDFWAQGISFGLDFRY